MSSKQSNAPLIGVGVAACAVCCVGPILGVLAAIGISTGVGYALFGFGAFAIGAAVAAFVVIRRRRRSEACPPTGVGEAVSVELTGVGQRS